jgi:hypothetical protein
MENTTVHCVVGVDKYDGPILQTMKIFSNEKSAYWYEESLQHQIDNRETYGIHYVMKFTRDIVNLNQ